VIAATTGGVLIDVRVIPRAKRSGVDGERGGAVLVRLQSPPLDGAANSELVDVLAAALGVTRRVVTIVAGERSRQKRVKVIGMDPATAAARLERGGDTQP
jgi:uncharacterized protein